MAGRRGGIVIMVYRADGANAPRSTLVGHGARDRAPALPVHRLEDLAAVEDLEGREQPGDFSGLQQVSGAGRAPAEVPLGGRGRFPS